MRAVLDTSVVIAGVEHVEGFDVALASPTYAELHFGVETAPTAETRTLRAARLDRLRFVFGPGLPFDDAAAASYGHICSLIRARGGNPRAHVIDRMIAAVAHSHRAAVITHNVNDFSGLDGLVPVIEA